MLISSIDMGLIQEGGDLMKNMMENNVRFYQHRHCEFAEVLESTERDLAKIDSHLLRKLGSCFAPYAHPILAARFVYYAGQDVIQRAIKSLGRTIS